MSTGTESAPLVLIVSGPSGSGKSTLVQRILELPGHHALGLVYYQAASRDRGQREVLCLRYGSGIRRHGLAR